MPRTVSALLRELPDGIDIALGDVAERFGTRAHGTMILILSIPDAIPLPIPSAGAILAIPLILISMHLAVFGETVSVPPRMARWRLPARSVALTKRYVVPFFAKAERVSAPRLGAIAGRHRLIGLVCLLLSCILLLPIPFMNTPPSLCLALLAWGMIQRDGAFVVAGLGLIAGTALALGFVVDLVRNLIA